MNRHLSRRHETLAGIARERHRSKPKALQAFVEAMAPHPEAYASPCICAVCGGTAEVFRDGLSLKEFTLSRMCQDCQDQVFTPTEED